MGIVGAVLNLLHCRVVFPQYWNSVVGAVGSNYWTLWFVAPNLKPSEIAQEGRLKPRWIHCPPLGLEATGVALKFEIWTVALFVPSLDCVMLPQLIKINTWTITLRSAVITSNYSITSTDYYSFAFAHFIPKSVVSNNRDEVKIHRVSIIR